MSHTVKASLCGTVISTCTHTCLHTHVFAHTRACTRLNWLVIYDVFISAILRFKHVKASALENLFIKSREQTKACFHTFGENTLKGTQGNLPSWLKSQAGDMSSIPG